MSLASPTEAQGPEVTVEALIAVFPQALAAMLAKCRPAARAEQPALEELTSSAERTRLIQSASSAVQRDFAADPVQRKRLRTGRKVRRLVLRSPRDLLIERGLHELLNQDASWAHPMSCAYTRGRSTAAPARAIREWGWLYDGYVKFDGINFFESVRHADAVAAVRRQTPDGRIPQIVGSLLKAGEWPDKQGRGLGTGTVLAPTLGNLVLTAPLDELFPREMASPYGHVSHMSKRVDAELWRRLGPVPLGYARYSDDGLVPYTGDRADGHRLEALLQKVFGRLGLRIRTEVGRCADGFEFVGLRYSPGVSSQQLHVQPGRALTRRILSEVVRLIEDEGRDQEEALQARLSRRAPYLEQHGVDLTEVYNMISYGLSQMQHR